MAAPPSKLVPSVLLSSCMELPGLNPRPGLCVQEVIKRKFGCSVSPISRKHGFFLVASFGRCKFRLSPDSVSVMLQATLGGSAADFRVLPLADRVFRFSVSSRLVGFHIIKFRSFECSLYKVFFHLWGFGGPNWLREWRSFCLEEDASWSTVRKGRIEQNKNFVRANFSFVEAVQQNPLTGANAIPVQPQQERRSVFDRLFFSKRF